LGLHLLILRRLLLVLIVEYVRIGLLVVLAGQSQVALLLSSSRRSLVFKWQDKLFELTLVEVLFTLFELVLIQVVLQEAFDALLKDVYVNLSEKVRLFRFPWRC